MMNTIEHQTRFLVFLAALLAAMGTLPATAQTSGATYQPSKVMSAVKRSNVRDGPGTRYKKIGLLKVGEKVRVTAKKGSWFKLEPQAGQRNRFVYAPLLTTVRPESGTDSTKSGSASSGLTTRTITYNSGSRYHGQTRNGKPHGRGIYTWSSGSRYEGEFRNGKRHGRGVYTRADGSRYEGEWRNGKKTGRGTYTFADGDRYTQEWRDGKSRDVHRPLPTQDGARCLTVDRTKSSMGYWVNRCRIGIDVIWRDEGSCRSRPGNKYPCSSFVKRKATATLEGKVWWYECKSPGGLGDVIAIEKNRGVYCVDSPSPGTLARKKAQRHNTQQAMAEVHAAIERANREYEAWGREMEAKQAREDAEYNAELQRIRTRTWNNIGQSLQTLETMKNQEKLRRSQAEDAEFQQYLQQLRNQSTQRAGDAGGSVDGAWCTTALGQCGVIIDGRCEYYDIVGGCR